LQEGQLKEESEKEIKRRKEKMVVMMGRTLLMNRIKFSIKKRRAEKRVHF
jgi:hypothetical protein